MNAYTAQIIYKIECEGIFTEQYEEQWRLIFADNEDLALAEARNFADGEASAFVDRHGRSICWKLLAVKDLRPLTLQNGELLFSAIKEAEPVAAPLWQEN